MAQESGHGDATAPPGEDAADSAVRLLEVVRDLTTELRPRQGDAEAVSLDSTLDRDLGLDSLARVELLTRLENAFDATLPEAVFVNSETPRDLLRALLGAKGARRPDANFEAREMALGGAEAVPRSAATLVEVLTWHAVAHPERPHVRLYSDDGEGEVITYGALKEGAEQIAAGLLRLGFEPGEAVVMMLPTGRDYFLTFFGALLAGGVPVPIYPPARAAHIEEHLRRHAAIVANCRGAVMVTVAEARPVARLLRSQVETLRHVVTPDELQEAPGGLAMPVVGAGDTAFLQYTSGSTGDPKGVVLSHANLLANIRVMGEVLEVGPDDVFVSWLPLYHDMGLIGAWLGSLHFAVPLVIMSPLAFLARPQRWLWAIHRYRGTLSAAPNFAYELCLRRIADADIEGLDLSSWRMAANGAEAVSPETVERFGARFKAHGFRRTALMPMYGLAENSVGLAFTPLGRGPLIDRVERRALSELGHAIPASASDEAAQAIVACGRPLPGHQVRIVDAGGRELAERRQGRLQFMGPSSTSGYFRNADATRALFQGEWLDSGDLAYVAEGDVYITGRAKDVIIKAGRNIYPAEFEEAIGELPGIRAGNVAVFGSIDASAGTERLVVLAETRKRDEAGRAELMVRINAVATDLAGMPPDDIVLAPPNTVLKTSSGKIRRAACREIFEQGLIGKPGRSLRWQVARLALSGVLPWLRRTWRGFGALAFAAYGWMVFLTLTLPTWLLVAGLPREPWRWAVIRGALKILAGATGTPLVVEGRDNLPPPGMPCVYVSNHASYLDGCVMMAALPGQFSFVAKAELMGNFVPRIFLGRIGTKFVERFDRQQGIDDARRIAAAVRGGRPLLYFAEGTFTRMPGLLPFHMGAFTAAAEAEVPVVPITIRGTRSMLRDDSGFPRPGAISVVIDPPMAPEAPDGEKADAWAAAIKLRNATRRRILARSGEPDLEYERPLL